jgi:hypothetical protein
MRWCAEILGCVVVIWDNLYGFYEMRRINHSEMYSDGDPCRLNRAAVGLTGRSVLNLLIYRPDFRFRPGKGETDNDST